MIFFKYKIRNGDTPHSISSRLGMAEEELKLFHNAHCEKIDILWFGSLNGVENLLIPLHFRTEVEKKQDKQTILPSALLPHSFFAPQYKVHEIFEYPQKPSLTIEYTVNLDTKKENNQLITISRKDFKTNGEIPDDKISTLTLACMEMIEPVDFIVRDNGSIIGFQNHKMLSTRFNKKHHDLEDYFVGEANRNYIDLFEANVSNEKFLFQQFRSTLLFQVLFPSMDWFQKEASWIESFHFFQNSFPAKCRMEPDHYAKNKDLTETRFKGQIIESCSLQELKRGFRFHETTEKNVSGEILLQYTTDRQNKKLIQAEGSLTLWHQETLYQKHHLTITQG